MGTWNSLVVFRNTSLTPSTVLTPERRANHASNTKVRLIELPETDELIDNSLLLRNAVQFRHETRIIHHACRVEVCREAKQGDKHQV